MKKALLPLCFPALLLAGQSAARANDFPTVDRVLYVQECIAAHPGVGRFEMTNKCACALDALAKELKYEEYVALSTASKASSIGGERGSYIRDAAQLQAGIKRYRALQARTEKACFIGAPD
ncbi:hypothetical protein [Verminephrobacter aporrectodeae]|uniref:hypothetical protein n=1 Tax=Verminephrobacter aporrectodeae TaxID=1110389 RepID=UPI0002377687|nr:hypothetical protein [Verminephrobacter aporrectodeae]